MNPLAAPLPKVETVAQQESLKDCSVAALIRPSALVLASGERQFTLYAPQQRWNVARYHLQGMIERLTQAPGEHQVKHLMHLSSKHRSDRGGEHGETLEDRCFERGVLLPMNVSEGLREGRTLVAADGP